ncbi:serine/threonine protein phosphatase [Streptomyces cyaneogriseus subsp. noncyanogenus]|uniref:Serine/threonine protein phosphatase n=1 Tax=Streptomyces cyaneogriseus subsp. noncyanogenus TaxID=477245 RepID=A0A0C5G0K1_9ACTN|nr:PP2C family serine/threonine-protein phosphatase [Streptomyces cyaneogriseus]AJP02060.1 serine/threonine protein phosphatase [Streptomyces cyaneogriseus subsp. noncyanogenus]
MSQMPQQAALPTCPSCAEPLESGDRFCGACGYDLSAVPARPEDHPTIALNGSAPGRAAGVEWPAAPQGDGPGRPDPAHRPADLPGTDAGGGPPRPAQPPQVPPPPQAPPGTPVPPPQGPPPSAQLPAQVPPQPPYPPAVAPQEPVPAPAPDPRVPAGIPAQGAAAEPAGGVPVCVACRAGRVDADGYCEHCGHAQPRERDHMEQESGPVAAVSDRGLRHHRNEDAFAVGHTVLPDGSPAAVAIVCDGVSSATRPDDASLAASRAAGESLLAALPRGTRPQQAMHDAIVAASHAVNALADEPATAREQAPHQNAPACTLVGAVVTSGQLVVGWVGDSRAYWVPTDRGAPAARLTEDDSWAAQMVAAGLMSEAEAYADERAHAITGWLGADAYELEPHTATFEPDRPGVVVICTDGLWNYAESAGEMAQVVPADAAVNPLHGARVLVGHALDGGGHDNVTVALVPFPAPPRGAGSV